MNIPKCVDCKWYHHVDSSLGDFKFSHSFCTSPHTEVVGDDTDKDDHTCIAQRKGWCGIEGRFFANSEEVEETPTPPLATPKEQLLGTPLPEAKAFPEGATLKDLGESLDKLGSTLNPEYRFDLRRSLLGDDTEPDTDSPIHRE